MDNDARKLVTGFIIASSIIVTFISLWYVGSAYDKAGSPRGIPIVPIEISMAVAFGLANIVNLLIDPDQSRWWITFLVGATLGVLFSLVGRFGYDLPRRIFNFNKKTEWRVHPIAFFLYGLIFAIIVRPLNRYILEL